MKRIDFYLQHLARHKADALELASDKPVTFRFPSGPRASNSPINHATVAQLVQECAPMTAMDDLKRAGATVFRHTSPDGMEVNVRVRAAAPGSWMVQVAPVKSNPAAASGQQALPPPTQKAAPAPQAAAPQQAAAPSGGIPIAPASAVAAPKPAAPAKPIDKNDKKAIKKMPNEAVPSFRVDMQPGEPRMNYYLRKMIAIDSSDLHMSSEVEPLCRRHGEMCLIDDGGVLTPEVMQKMLDEIMPERNKEQFAETNDTDFAHEIQGLARFRANVFRDLRGPGAVFRQIPFEILTPQQIGLPEKVLDLCWLTKGLVLVTGPTGSGKSTTLASMIDYINENRADHIITIEDPVEFVHPNKKCLINQREVGVHTKSFKAALKAALREDPDIVLVGEMRDLETISIAIETAETGHLVFGTLHTSSAPSTVDRIIDQFPADQQSQIRVMLSESLKGVVSQVLCKKIGGGRCAGYEILIGTTALANLIREGKTFQIPSVMQTGRKLGMQTMNDHLLEHVLAGRVEADEAYMKSNNKERMKQLFSQNNVKLTIVDDN